MEGTGIKWGRVEVATEEARVHVEPSGRCPATDDNDDDDDDVPLLLHECLDPYIFTIPLILSGMSMTFFCLVLRTLQQKKGHVVIICEMVLHHTQLIIQLMF